MKNQPNRRQRLSPAEVAIIISSGFIMAVILLLLPLLFVFINEAIYHGGNDPAAILGGLGVAIVLDIVIFISIPMRLHRLRTKLRERERERVK